MASKWSNRNSNAGTVCRKHRSNSRVILYCHRRPAKNCSFVKLGGFRFSMADRASQEVTATKFLVFISSVKSKQCIHRTRNSEDTWKTEVKRDQIKEENHKPKQMQKRTTGKKQTNKQKGGQECLKPRFSSYWREEWVLGQRRDKCPTLPLGNAGEQQKWWPWWELCLWALGSWTQSETLGKSVREPLTETAALARHDENHLHELSHNRRAPWGTWCCRRKLTRRIREGPQGGRRRQPKCPTNLPESFVLESILAESCMCHQEGPWVRPNMGTGKMIGQRQPRKLTPLA